VKTGCHSGTREKTTACIQTTLGVPGLRRTTGCRLQNAAAAARDVADAHIGWQRRYAEKSAFGETVEVGRLLP